MFARLFNRHALAQVTALSTELSAAQQRISELQSLVDQQVVDLEKYRSLVSAAPVKPARQSRAIKADKLSAFEFWQLHAKAVEAIRAVYGDNWTVAAPFGETVLVTVDKAYLKAKTERGTVITWRRDNRFPAASYWASGAMPEGVTEHGDYKRADPTEAGAFYRASVTGKKTSAVSAHDEQWHLNHGYVRVGREWIPEILHRQNIAHQEAIEDYRVAIAAAEDCDLAEAAD